MNSQLRRRAVTVLAFIVGTAWFVPLIQANVQELAKNRGWDQFLVFLVSHWPTMLSWSSYIGSVWFALSSGFVFGAASYAWLDYWLRRPSGVPNTPTPLGTKPHKLFLGESTAEHDVFLFDAIWRAYFGGWKILKEGERLSSKEEYQRLHDLAEQEFPQKAFDGRLKIWGKRNGLHVWETIPREFWKTHRINYLSLTHGNPHSIEVSTTVPPIQPIEKWIELKTSRRVIEKLWPSVV